MIFRTVNPYRNEPIAVYEEMSHEALTKAVAKASWAFKHWKRTSYAYRTACFTKLAALLRAQQQALATLIATEMGKPITEAKAEIEKCAACCEYYVQHAERFLQPEALPSDGRQAWAAFEPLGTVLGIMPWNFPFWQVFRYAVPAMMAGNVTLLKHAPNTFGCGQAIEALFLQASFPEGALQHLLIDTPKVEAIIAAVNAVTFTGSNAAGAKVASMAGKYLKPSVMELGGSDPLIVLKDADLKHAAQIAVRSRMLNGGQSCIAAKRFIVEKPVYQEFKELVAKELQQYKPGNPLDETTLLGPLARIDLAEKLFEQTKHSILLGAHVEVQGGQYEAHFAPYLLSNVQEGMPAFDEEMFGPVISLVVANDEQNAIILANKTPYGLGASLWTQDMEKAQRLIPEIEAGAVFVNALVKSDPRLPFGGTKQSGYGRELSHWGLKAFVNTKTVYFGPLI